MTEPIPAISGYPALGVALLIVVVLALAMMGVSVLLGPRKPNTTKLMPYESGMAPIGLARRRFGIHYYVVAMLFIIFDIETIFLYPWAIQMLPAVKNVREVATAHAKDAVFLFLEMAVFMTILFVGYIYMIRKGALDWE